MHEFVDFVISVICRLYFKDVCVITVSVPIKSMIFFFTIKTRSKNYFRMNIPETNVKSIIPRNGNKTIHPSTGFDSTATKKPLLITCVPVFVPSPLQLVQYYVSPRQGRETYCFSPCVCPSVRLSVCLPVCLSVTNRVRSIT